MSGRKSRLYRAAANQHAKRGNIFGQGNASFMTRWRKFVAWFSPKARAEYRHVVGWWYKRWLKKEAKAIAAIDRDPDTRAFQQARRKVGKTYAQKRGAV